MISRLSSMDCLGEREGAEVKGRRGVVLGDEGEGERRTALLDGEFRSHHVCDLCLSPIAIGTKKRGKE